MTNNTTLNTGTGGDVIAGEDILGVKYQLVKLVDPTALSVLPIGTVANPLRTDPTGTTIQPVSAVSLPLAVGAATSVKQDTQITSLGATTEVEASGDGSIIALLKRLRTLLGSLGLDATLVAIRDRLPAALVGGRLDVNVGNSPAVTVTSGSITANAGANLNTSALALEAGGNLAAIAGKDFATQTTLALIKAKTDNLDALSSTLATQATLALIKAKTDNIPADPSREGGVLATAAKQDTGNTSLSSIDGKIPALGQALSSASVPVVRPYSETTEELYVKRQAFEIQTLIARDQAVFSYARRSHERVVASDRRGNFERGNSR